MRREARGQRAVDDAVVVAENDSGTISRGTNCAPSQTGFIADFDTPRIATWGGLTIGVKNVPPMPPSDEIVNVAPCISSALSLPSRARPGQLAQLGGDLEQALAVDVAG